MRSVWQHARSWVRRIYLLTNGQIPAWLNLHHPQIRLVTHEQVFVNKSHLPTFSSPAIETHLHRIPGLTPKFLYLNDDVMFGSEVWPDDFFTRARGQRIYLSWPVPQCAEGCSSNWLGDGYCDLACNVSECDWDNGDCENVTLTSPILSGVGTQQWWWGQPQQSTTSQQSPLDRYCVPGCPDSWIGDKYCDRACRNVQCGMDAGDCGIQELKDNLYGIVLRIGDENTTLIEDSLALQQTDTERSSKTQTLVELWTHLHPKSDHYSSSTDNTTTFPLTNTTSTLITDSVTNRTVFVDHAIVPASLPSLYIDLRYVMGVNNRRLVDANHDNAALVRTATISQRHKVMVLTFHRKQEGQTVTILLELQGDDGSQQTMELTFKLSLGSSNSSSQDSESRHPSSSNNNNNNNIHTKTYTKTQTNDSLPLKSEAERSLKEMTSAGVDPLTPQQLSALRRASVCFFFSFLFLC
jgi:hypothetical protein